jgi:general secretion pathway protein E
MRFADILLELGAVDPARLDELRTRLGEDESPRTLAELLLAEGLLDETKILRAFAKLYGLDLLESLDEAQLDPELVAELPIAWARANCVLPIRHRGEIGLLVSRPDSEEQEKYVALLLQCELVPVLATASLIRSAIEDCYVSREGGSAELMASFDSEPAISYSAGERGQTDLLSTVENAPVTSLVNALLLEAFKLGASDIHIEPHRERLQLRYRIDGVLYEQPAPPKRMQEALISRLKVMAHLDIAEKRLPQDGMAKVSAGERGIDIRVSTVPVADGERMVLRILSRHSVLMPMEGLGMSPELLAASHKLMAEPQGIVLVTGPTGSGKTTTLYACLQQLDTQHLNVITIEDPIEYELEGISQIQVKPRIGLGFAEGLRHILRQDPDAVLVGEIRDAETAEIAIRASLTGHLVLSTIHTNDAVSTPLRITDMGIKPYLLSESLRAVIAQRLVRRLCPHCRRAEHWSPATLADLPQGLERPAESETHYSAVGCEKCREGYHGRIAIFEYLLVNPEIKTAIRKELRSDELAALATRYGMETLRQDALRKIRAGTSSIKEMQRVLGSFC